MVYRTKDKDGDLRNKKDIKRTISHEIGHMFGLEHPLGEYFGVDHSNTIMGGDERLTSLTAGDMSLLQSSWDQTHDIFYNQFIETWQG